MTQGLRDLIEELDYHVEARAAYLSAPRGAMRAPFHGEFANAPASVIKRLQWWVHELKSALEDE